MRILFQTVALLFLVMSLAQAAVHLVQLTPPAESIDHKELREPIDWKKGKWGRFSKYIGTYDYDGVLNDPEVNEALQHLLSDEFDHLAKNLYAHGPIGFSSDCLVFTGNAAHSGGSEEAILLVCLYKGTIHAAILSDQKVYLYSSAEGYRDLNPTLQDWIQEREFRRLTGPKQPANLLA